MRRVQIGNSLAPDDIAGFGLIFEFVDCLRIADLFCHTLENNLSKKNLFGPKVFLGLRVDNLVGYGIDFIFLIDINPVGDATLDHDLLAGDFHNFEGWIDAGNNPLPDFFTTRLDMVFHISRGGMDFPLLTTSGLFPIFTTIVS